jgi:hypothetical protein
MKRKASAIARSIYTEKIRQWLSRSQSELASLEHMSDDALIEKIAGTNIELHNPPF